MSNIQPRHERGLPLESERLRTPVESPRYNRLVETLATPGARLVERSLVGVTVAVSKLSHSMASRISARIRPGAELEKIPRRCDIFIVSYNPGLIEARLVLAHELWKQQLSADLVRNGGFPFFFSTALLTMTLAISLDVRRRFRQTRA